MKKILKFEILTTCRHDNNIGEFEIIHGKWNLIKYILFKMNKIYKKRIIEIKVYK